jgi:hypothetical protein
MARGRSFAPTAAGTRGVTRFCDAARGEDERSQDDEGNDQRLRRISSALSHSGSCTRSVKRHLSPQLPHTTDLPSGCE